jgi:hypothetical protein
VQATNPRVTFPPFLPAQALLGPPVACCQSALFHVCPAFPQGATAAKAVAESAFWRGTNQHSITPRLLCCCNCSRVSDKNHRHLTPANSSTLVLYLVSPLSSSVVQARIPCWKFHLESHTRSFQKLHSGNDRPRFRSAPHQRHSSKLLRLCESTSPRVLFEHVNLTCAYPNFP